MGKGEKEIIILGKKREGKPWVQATRGDLGPFRFKRKRPFFGKRLNPGPLKGGKGGGCWLLRGLSRAQAMGGEGGVKKKAATTSQGKRGEKNHFPLQKRDTRIV